MFFVFDMKGHSKDIEIQNKIIQIFTQGRFPEVGQKQKTEKRKRLNDGNTNGQAFAHIGNSCLFYGLKRLH